MKQHRKIRSPQEVGTGRAESSLVKPGSSETAKESFIFNACREGNTALFIYAWETLSVLELATRASVLTLVDLLVILLSCVDLNKHHLRGKGLKWKPTEVSPRFLVPCLLFSADLLGVRLICSLESASVAALQITCAIFWDSHLLLCGTNTRMHIRQTVSYSLTALPLLNLTVQ